MQVSLIRESPVDPHDPVAPAPYFGPICHQEVGPPGGGVSELRRACGYPNLPLRWNGTTPGVDGRGGISKGVCCLFGTSLLSLKLHTHKNIHSFPSQQQQEKYLYIRYTTFTNHIRHLHQQPKCLPPPPKSSPSSPSPSRPPPAPTSSAAPPAKPSPTAAPASSGTSRAPAKSARP